MSELTNAFCLLPILRAEGHGLRGSFSPHPLRSLRTETKYQGAQTSLHLARYKYTDIFLKQTTTCCQKTNTSSELPHITIEMKLTHHYWKKIRNIPKLYWI